jgi:hypothetical protein
MSHNKKEIKLTDGRAQQRVVVSRTPTVLFKPRLVVELAPQTCWPSNVRSLMKEWAWRKLAGLAAQDAGGRCEVCDGHGRRHPVECHETWLYDDARKAQRLMKLTALCPMCHHVKHFGRSLNTGHGEAAYAWLCRVNGWTREHAEEYIAAVFAQFAERSQFQWSLDLRSLEGYDVTPHMLGLPAYVLQPWEREQMQHRRALSIENAIRFDTATRHQQSDGT